MPIQIRKPSPDPMPELFRQEAASRYPSREPTIFESVDGWVLRILHRKIPPSEGVREVMRDLMMDGWESQHDHDQTGASYALSVYDDLETIDDTIHDRLRSTRDAFRSHYAPGPRRPAPRTDP